jgi:hypothetical protein
MPGTHLLGELQRIGDAKPRFDLSAIEITSPVRHSADGTLSRLPLTMIAPCEGWRAPRRASAVAHPVHDVVEPRLEELQQVLAGRVLAAPPTK